MGDKRYLIVQSDYRKVQVPVDAIAYITIDGRKTKITKADGSALRTNRSLKDVYAELPEEIFTSVNRGIVVSKSYIKNEKAGVITMTDGTQFKRRVRSDRVREKPRTEVQQATVGRTCPAAELDAWLGSLTLPLCILELVYQGRNGGAEFLIRYCNRAMETLEQVRLVQIQDQPITTLKGVGDPKWLPVFADVAINGSARVTDDAWMEDGRTWRLLCYQPQSGYCALVLVDLTRENRLVQDLFHRRRR